MKVFIEEQRFIQSWLVVVKIISFLVLIVIILKQVKSSDKLQIEPSSIIAIITVGLVFLLFYFSTLKTRVDEKGISFRFIPFHFKDKYISWNEISKAYVREYNPILEYGGWGLRTLNLFRQKRGIAYNVSGIIGLQLELKNGKKILIGTQKPNEVNQVLSRYKEKFSDHEI